MNPVVELAFEVIQPTFPDASVFAYRIEEDYQKLSKLPVIKVESVNDTNTSYGSNRYLARGYRIQVMAFIDINVTDIEEFKDKLDRSAEKARFFQAYAEDYSHDEIENVHVILRQYTCIRRKN